MVCKENAVPSWNVRMTESDIAKAQPALEVAKEALEELRRFVVSANYAFEQVLEKRESIEYLGRKLGSAYRGRHASDKVLPEDDALLFAGLFPPEPIERFAKSQVDSAFPYLHELAIVRLWTILESTVDDFTVEILHLRPAVAMTETVRGLRGPLLEYSEANEAEKASYLAGVLKQEVKASLKAGAGRFEAMLTAIGMGGAIDGEVRRTLLELSEIRHVLVHRAGRADRRLLEACPWIDVELGERVRVSSPTFQRYYAAVNWYFIELLRRYGAVWYEEYRKSDSDECKRVNNAKAMSSESMKKAAGLDSLLRAVTSDATSGPADDSSGSNAV